MEVLKYLLILILFFILILIFVWIVRFDLGIMLMELIMKFVCNFKFLKISLLFLIFNKFLEV